MSGQNRTCEYFRHLIPVSATQWQQLDLADASRRTGERNPPPVLFYRQLALALNRVHPVSAQTVYASHLYLFAKLQSVYRFMIDNLAEKAEPGLLEQSLRSAGHDPAGAATMVTEQRFVELFPPAELLSGPEHEFLWLAKDSERRRMVLREMLLLHNAVENPAAAGFSDLFDDKELAGTSSYGSIAPAVMAVLSDSPVIAPLRSTLGKALRAPVMAAPDSLAGQVRFVIDTWGAVLPPEMLAGLDTALDILLEEKRERGWGGDPGPPPVLEFKRAGRSAKKPPYGDAIFSGFDYPEYENFSRDADWMSNVVLIAKMVYVWLDQLSRSHGYPITRLDQIPDAELDRLATYGFTGLWLIGLWERSPASQRIKQICGNHDAIASAYSLYDYEVAEDLGGWEALGNFRKRAALRGIRLASDMVPNHTGIYSRWVIQHPDWFVQTDYPPFPTYQFTGEDLSHDGDVCIQVEDGYWNSSDAAVVFKHYDRRDGRTRYIYHGNDGTTIPWNDTAQLNYLISAVREAVIQAILHVARTFPIIRFDAAMTLAKKHYQRLWFPLRGHGGGIPSRAEHGMRKEEFDAVFPVEFWREVVDRVAVEAPDTLLLAEAFWMMEGYFVRTLGMHRVYNSAFMNMLKTEENHKYRHTIKNVLEFDPEVIKRFVNFMNNPDEKTAVEQFGSQDKYFGACVLLVTMPGLPMFGHGQIEGFHERYGMEYKRAYRDEQIDEGLLGGHRLWIFPLLRLRWLFSGSENFMLYDFYSCDFINDNVFAYSNRCGSHHSLVMYHNSFSTAAGWIRETSGFAVKSGNGVPEIRRTTLGAFLGLSGEDGVYCTFRDHVTGLNYLRNARELYECGLYVEMKEYQFYVFLDFSSFADDEQGSWSDLCELLDGMGVESLQDELKQQCYRKLNEAFRAAVRQTVPERRAGMDCTVTVTCAQAFFEEMKNTMCPPPGVGLTEEPLAAFKLRLKQLEALLGRKHVFNDVRAFRARLTRIVRDEDDGMVLWAWMLLAGMQTDVLELFGLDCSLRRMLERDGAGQRIRFLKALLELSGTGMSTAEMFSLPASRDFLAVHESGGTEWFNKERFAELAEWLAITYIVNGTGDAKTTGSLIGSIVRAERLVKKSCELAAVSGYRTRLYCRMAVWGSDVTTGDFDKIVNSDNTAVYSDS